MNTLPSSIASSLKEAGFTPTEILIIRRLIEDGALPLRQLAAKTGKSTGVLDQAMKKLLARGIVTKESVNESPSYSLVSLETVARAIEDDVESKRAMLQRKFEDFESFLHSLAFERGRPDVEHFAGPAGIKRAYCKLLGEGEELIGYSPSSDGAADDPLRDFRVELYRERRRRKIFSRIITHDTPAGRRFQSRDPFEYRTTLLVAREECPFSFEKLIIGNAVACFNHGAQRACVIRYPELAQTERALFETLWRDKAARTVIRPSGERVTPSTSIPWKTRTLSQMRDFFLSPKSLLVLAAFALLSGGITAILSRRGVEDADLARVTFTSVLTFFGFFFLFTLIRLAAFQRSLFSELLAIVRARSVLVPLCTCFLLALSVTAVLYVYNRSLNLQRVREKVQSIATTGALQFDPDDLEALREQDDWKKPEWAKVVKQLEQIRENNEGIFFAYIFRRSQRDPNQLEFISDSHSLNPFANTDDNPSNDIDIDHNGILNSIDVLQWPGQPYPVPHNEIWLAFNTPMATKDFYEDSWGRYITGYAPIRDGSTKVIAALAVDYQSKRFAKLNASTFAPIAIFFVFLFLFLVVRLTAFSHIFSMSHFLLSIVHK